MKRSLLAQDLRRKAERALASARELQERDPDGSVNRSYYAMFDIARAALLKAGIAEDDLPRTHRGVISAFSKHAVQSGRIDQQLSGALGRTESLRLMADYMGKSLDAKTASGTVGWAEEFVRTVEKAFALSEPSLSNDLENDRSDEDPKVSEPDFAMKESETGYKRLQPVSLEEIRRQARENWLKLRQQNVAAARGLGTSSKEADRGIKEDQSQSVDDDLD